MEVITNQVSCLLVQFTSEETSEMNKRNTVLV